MIYLDNAATSFPKPVEVIYAVSKAMTVYGANPGRSGHNMSLNSAMCVYSARQAVNSFFNGYGIEYTAFTLNCTHSLNIAIKGTVCKGDHVVISALEHNSVLRPIHTLAQRGELRYSVFDVYDDTDKTAAAFKAALEPGTRLAVVTAVSNVFGNILPLKELALAAHENGTLFFVDAAQAAGVIPLDMKNTGIDCLCAPGHKGLLGPMGTGVLLHNGCITGTLTEGGTGTSSFDFLQPEGFPERLESGTLNIPGINGLAAGIHSVESCGIDSVFKEESELCEYLFNELKNIKGVTLYREKYNRSKYAPIVSFNINNMHSETVTALLNEGGIAVRGGYHCAPLAHRFYKTEASGAVRVSPSQFNSEKDINNLLNLVNQIALCKKM